MRKRDPVREVKRILKLHEKKKKLEEKLEELQKEIDGKETGQFIIFIGMLTLFLFGFLVGGALLRDEEILHKILGGFSIGISVGMFIFFLAMCEWDTLNDQIKEIDKEMESVEKKIEEIKKEIE